MARVDRVGQATVERVKSVSHTRVARVEATGHTSAAQIKAAERTKVVRGRARADHGGANQGEGLGQRRANLDAGWRRASRRGEPGWHEARH